MMRKFLLILFGADVAAYTVLAALSNVWSWWHPGLAVFLLGASTVAVGLKVEEFRCTRCERRMREIERLRTALIADGRENDR